MYISGWNMKFSLQKTFVILYKIVGEYQTHT